MSACFFRTLDRFPLFQHCAAVAHIAFAKDMRVTPDEFLRHVTENIIDIESVLFLRDFRVHHDEQEKIAQFFAEICAVIRAHRSGYFVSLFNQSRQKRIMRLLAVQGTTARRPQFRDDLAESFKRGHFQRSAAESRSPAALPLSSITDSSTSLRARLSLGMTFAQIRHSERCVPNSEISPEDFRLT